MDEQMRKALEEVRREAREELHRTVGEATQRAYDGIRTMQENFLVQQEMMQKLMDQMAEFTRHMGFAEISEEERRNTIKGKGVVIDESLNTTTPTPAPPQPFQVYESHTSPSQTGAASPSIVIEAPSPDNSQDEMREIKEKLKAIEGLTKFPGIDLSKMSLVSDLVLPPKFKMPDFEKFNGTQDPFMHLLKFTRKMANYTKDDKIMIFCFQESLEGGAAEWYANLGAEEVKTWNDAANLFALYYKHNAESCPTRDTLRSMEKKKNETFKEYARRWRETACRVRPALGLEEFSTIFIKTLDNPYHDRLWGFSGDDFTSVMKKGELLELAIKEGRIEGTPMKKPITNSRRKEEEAHLVASDAPRGSSRQTYQPSFYHQQTYHPPPRSLTFPQRTPIMPPTYQLRPQHPTPPTQPKYTFTPLNGTYSQAFAQLRDRGILGPVIGTEVKGPNFPKWYDPNATCEYHSGLKGHSIENCLGLKFKIEELLKKGVIALDRPNVNRNPLPQHNQGINVVEIEAVGTFEHLIAPVEPFIILADMKTEEPAAFTVNQPFILSFDDPQPPPMKDAHNTPWSYKSSTETANISGLSGITRSGRVYNHAAKSFERGQSSQAPVVQSREEEKGKEKEVVTDEEAGEFLKYLKHSEYSVLEQLNKTPARISILQLLQNSPHHKEALDRVLEKAYVAQDISTAQLEGIVGNVAATNFISFSDDEIPPDGCGSVKALYITATCKGHILPKILIDNGSALNLIPTAVLVKLKVDKEQLRGSSISVRAFDGTRRDVLGKVELPLQIGPIIYNIEFQVMDIKSSYNCLLGRPWIHIAGAVPSSLHQKIKLVKDDKLITIFGEEGMIGMVSAGTPYIEEPSDTPDCSYRAFEIVNALDYPRNKTTKIPTSMKTPVQQMLRFGLKPGMGLGKNGQGIRWPIEVQGKQDGRGLGYGKPGRDQKRIRETDDSKGWKWTEPLYKIFRKGGTLFEEPKETIVFKMTNMSINATGEEEESSDLVDIAPCPPGFQLKNWREEPIPCMNLDVM